MTPKDPDLNPVDQRGAVANSEGGTLEYHEQSNRARDDPRSEVDATPSRWLRGLEWFVVFIGSTSFALSFGFNYGIDNQVVYNLGALHLLNPELFKQDWFVRQTTSYHPTFEYFSAFLLWLDSDGWAFGIATTVVITVIGVLMYWLCRMLSRELALASFLLLLALAFATRLRGVGSSYIADYILQPSTLGSLGFVGAMLAFIGKRWTLSGILLAIGGLFHANYLILGGVVFGLAQLLLGRDGLVRRGVYQLTAPTLGLLLFIPTILKAAAGGDVQLARDILFHVRSPWHFSPVSYEVNFLPFVGWHLIGIGAGLETLLRRSDAGRRTGVLVAALVVVIWTGTAAATFFGSSVASQLFVQRLAPHLELLFQALWAVATVQLVVSPTHLKEYSSGSLTLGVAGIGCVLLFSASHGSRGAARLLLVGLALVAASQALCALAGKRLIQTGGGGGPLLRRIAHGFVLAVVLMIVSASALKDFRRLREHSTLLAGLGPGEDKLYAWLRQNTPKDAVLLTPPGVEGMRFHSQRAIVVDWKAVPIVSEEIIVWHRRLSDVSGRLVRSQDDLSGYAQMDQGRLEELKRTYHVSYVVTASGDETKLGGDLVYKDSCFAVLKL